MKIKNVVPVISVKALATSTKFYEETLGFELVYKNDWYAHLRSSGDEKVEIGFVASNHPTQPAIFQPVFEGRGVFYSLEVEDVGAALEKMQSLNVPIKLSRRLEPWGEDHFAIEDPNGVILNIGKTDPAKRGQVDMREHMMARER